MSAVAQQRWTMPVAGLDRLEEDMVNALLVEWAHNLGPCERPFGQQGWAFMLDGQPISVAMSASTVSSTVAGHRRQEVVELARLCSKPGMAWATRPMLRMWREIAGPRWPHWTPMAAISYSQNAVHSGDIYRFDGWEKFTDSAGSSGGGTWSTARARGDAPHGVKSGWIWRYSS